MKATLIIKRTLIDDSDASVRTDAKLCNSIEEANAAVLAELNEEWETKCSSFAELADTLMDSDIDAGTKESGELIDLAFYWYDNGKGEEFLISEVTEDYTHMV